MKRFALALILLLAPAAAHAQAAATLDRADSLRAAGSTAEARTLLDRWWKQHGERHGLPAAERARALLLRGRLATFPPRAEADYLAVVQGLPTTRSAPGALLRLGQSLLARGEADRAATYLNRLLSDYPAARERPAGALWLARALQRSGGRAAACAAARTGTSAAKADAELAALLRDEVAADCGAAKRKPR